MNNSSYNAFAKQVDLDNANASLNKTTVNLGGRGVSLNSGNRDNTALTSSPLSRFKQEKRGPSGPINNLTGFSAGGVNFANMQDTKASVTKDLSSIIKNKAIFEKAQQKTQHNVDWYAKMQESKDAFLGVEHGRRLPNLEGGEFRDPSGAFDEMISAKKELRDLTARKTAKKFKLSKD